MVTTALQIQENVIRRGDWAQRLAAADAETARRLAVAYQRTLVILQEETDGLIAKLDEQFESGQAPTVSDVRALRDFQRLRGSIEREMNGFAVILQNEMSVAQTATVQIGIDAAVQMAAASVGNAAPQLIAVWNSPDPAAIASAVNYLNKPAMIDNLKNYGVAASDDIADYILSFIAQGVNPRLSADAIRRRFAMPYSWADNMTRTLQNWSYRTATHTAYASNGGVVEGWVWTAVLDARTCISCISRHGRLYPLSAILNDHHRGRCTPVPYIRGSKWLGDYETGERWMRALTPTQQRATFNNNLLYEAWAGGDVQWDELSRPYQDPIYGEMLAAASYKSLRR